METFSVEMSKLIRRIKILNGEFDPSTPRIMEPTEFNGPLKD